MNRNPFLVWGLVALGWLVVVAAIVASVAGW